MDVTLTLHTLSSSSSTSCWLRPSDQLSLQLLSFTTNLHTHILVVVDDLMVTSMASMLRLTQSSPFSPLHLPNNHLTDSLSICRLREDIRLNIQTERKIDLLWQSGSRSRSNFLLAFFPPKNLVGPE